MTVKIVPAWSLPPLAFTGDEPDPARFDPPTMDCIWWSSSDGPRPEGWRPPASPEDVLAGRARPFTKPAGGLYTSPLERDCAHVTLPTWAFRGYPAEKGELELEPSWRVEPEPDARVALCDGWEDWEVLTAAYPHRDPHYRHMVDIEIDFARLAEAVDAFWLTARGLHECQRAYHPGRMPVLLGWDVPTVLWLRWKFRHWERPELPPGGVHIHDE